MAKEIEGKIYSELGIGADKVTPLTERGQGTGPQAVAPPNGDVEPKVVSRAAA